MGQLTCIQSYLISARLDQILKEAADINVLYQLLLCIFFLLGGVYSPSGLFHSFLAESIVRWGENGRSREKTPNHPQAELGLSHMGPALTHSSEMMSDLEH